MANNSHNSIDHQKRLSIGFLAPFITHDWALQPWLGMVDVAREREANLICLHSDELRSPHGFSAQANIVSNLINTEQIRGLIVWPTLMGAHIEQGEIEQFCESYATAIPVVNMETKIASYPYVPLDSYHGMSEALDHLIVEHGYQRIACITLTIHHTGFQERYRAYTEALARHNLPLDPNIVLQMPAEAQIETLRDSLPQLLAAGIDAIVATADSIALMVLELLQEKGIRVPQEVALVGFDDVAESSAVTPPLTTVGPQWYEFGRQTAETLLTLIDGEPASDPAALPSPLIVRQSCGCPDAAVAQAAIPPAEVLNETFSTAFPRQQADLAAEMAQVAALSTELTGQIVDSFAAEMAGGLSGGFLSTLTEILAKTSAAGHNIMVWQNALSVLARRARPYLGEREQLLQAESLWQQARVLIGRTAHRAQTYRVIQEEKQAQLLRDIGSNLMTTFDMEQLLNVLREMLPRLEIPGCYLALYEDPQPYQYPQPAPEWSWLLLAYNQQETTTLTPGERRFPSRQLIPEEMWPTDRAYAFVVEPLYFRDNQMGFVLFEVGPREGRIYEGLREQISSALQGTLLLREQQQTEAALEQAYARVEQEVKERTAELQREVTERQRLQQEIIENQQQAIRELSTPVIPVLEGVIVMPLVGNIDTLRARDITRALLAGISRHRANVIILDITGVPLLDSGVANHLNKAVQAARLKGARTIITGISEAVAETIVDLGLDWSELETLSDLQTGLRAALVGPRQH